MPLKTSLYIPLHIILDDLPSAGEKLIRIARAAEAAGFDGCNLTDHPAPTARWRQTGGHEAFDPFAALAFIAAATTRLRLITHIVVLPYRNPFVTAKAVATLDVLSNGRVTLGIGAGYLKGEYAALGVDFTTRGAAMDEAITVMKLAWSGEPVAFQGTTFSAREALPEPVPIQRPNPPIWGGGNSRRAIRRAAELCDGWAPFFVSPEQAAHNATEALVTMADLRRSADHYRTERERYGRQGVFDLCVGPPQRPARCDAADRQMMIEQAGEMAEAGVTWFLTSLPDANLEQFMDIIAWCGAEVLPSLRDR